MGETEEFRVTRVCNGIFRYLTPDVYASNIINSNAD